MTDQFVWYSQWDDTIAIFPFRRLVWLKGDHGEIMFAEILPLGKTEWVYIGEL